MSKDSANSTKSKARAAEAVQPARKRQAAAHQTAESGAVAWAVQTSLQVGAPGDRYEQEAEQQADAFSMGGEAGGIQRMATDDLQGAEADGGGSVSSDFESSLSNSGGGEPLPTDTQSSMEGHFGADFSAVRVHNDSQSASMNQSLGARAFTHGSDVYFNEGEYNPGTSSGDHLIAHELTHTVQQGAAIQTSPQIQKAEQDPEPEPEPEAPAPAPAQNQPAAAGAAAPPPSGGGNGGAATGEEAGPAATGPPPPEQVATDPAQTAPRSAEPQNTNPPSIPAEDQQPVQEDPEADAPKKARRSAKISNEVAEVKATDFSSMNSEGAVEAYATSSPSQIAASQKGFGAVINNKLEGEKKATDQAMPTLVASTEGSLQKGKKGAPEGKEEKAELQDGVVGPNPPEAKLPEHQEGGALPDYSNLAKDADKNAPKEEGGGFWDWIFKAFKNSMGGISTKDGSVNTSAGPKPKVNTTGEGDPQRAQKMRGEGDTKVENERSQTADLIKSNPGQENIQPQYFSEENPVDLNLTVAKQADMATTDVMEQYVNLPLPEEVRAAADEGLAPLLETTMAEPRKKVADAAVDRDNTKETEIKKAEAEVERLNTEADQKQQKTVKDSRKMVADEQTRGVNEAKKYTEDFNKEANKEQKSSADQITGKIETANKDAKDKLDQAEKDAEKKKKEGEKEAADAKKKADKDSENDSWWGKFKKAVKSAVSWLTDKIAGIFKAIREAITELINAAKEWALEQIEKARKWVVDKLNKFRDWLKEKVNKYLKDFPALRKRVNKFIDDTVDGAIKTVNDTADALKKGVTALADGLTAAINKALEVFETVLTTALNVAGALVTGDFIGALREGIKGACKVLGIDPQQIFDFMDRAGEMLAGILRDPGGFFTNVGKGISQGFEQFATNIKKHLINGLFDWLTGEMSDVQIQIPTNFDPKGIFYFVAQLLGVTYDQIREKVVKEIGPNGEEVVSAMETTVELVMDFVENGPMALWNRAVQHWEKMKEDAKGFLQDMLKWEVVKAGIKFLVKKLAFGPLSAFVAAVELIYDLVVWLMERWESIKAFATSVYDSVAALAAGDVAGAANAIESALARSISPILSLLAGMLKLNGLGKKVQKALDKIREPIHTKIVDPAIKWIVNKGKSLVAAGGNLIAGKGAKGQLDAVGKKLEKPPASADKPLQAFNQEMKTALATANKGQKKKMTGKVLNAGSVEKDSKIEFELKQGTASQKYTRTFATQGESKEHDAILKKILDKVDAEDTGVSIADKLANKEKLVTKLIDQEKSKLKQGLKISIEANNKQTIAKDGGIKWKGKIAPNDADEDRLDKINPAEIKMVLKDKPKVKHEAKYRKGKFKDAESGKHKIAYIGNVRGSPSEDVPIRLADKYRDEAFDDQEDADKRFALVLGINLIRDLKDKNRKEVIKTVEATSGWDDKRFPLGVFSYIWEPQFEQNGKPLSFEKVQEKYKDKKTTEEERKAIEGTYSGLKSGGLLPYGLFSDQVKDHAYTSNFMNAFRAKSEKVFVHTGDPDVVSLRVDKSSATDYKPEVNDKAGSIATGLFNRYDALLKKEMSKPEYAGSLPSIIAGGYFFEMDIFSVDVATLTKDKEKQKLANTVASAFDMQLRQAMAKINPKAVYFPEPNTLVNVTGKEKVNLSVSYGLGASEGKHYINELLKRRGELDMRYEAIEIVTGGDDRFNVKTSGLNQQNVSVNSKWFEGVLLPDLSAIKSMLAQAQSHFKARAWRKNMEAVYGSKKGMGDVYMEIRDHYMRTFMRMIGSGDGEKVTDSVLKKYLTTDGEIRANTIDNPVKMKRLTKALITRINRTKKGQPSAEKIQRWEDKIASIISDRPKAQEIVSQVNLMAKATDSTLREFLLAGLKR